MATEVKTLARGRTPLDPGVEGRLRDRFVALLEEGGFGPGDWAERMREMEAEAGVLSYSVLLFVVAHLEVPPRKARECFEQVLVEWREMNRRLGEAVDLRVAVLQYFLRRERKLQNPAIVELRILKRTEDSAIHDELTRLYNFRHFRHRLREEVRRSDRYDAPLALLMIDADDFKVFNDTYGHLAGNAALRRLADALRRSLRDVDFAARYGGEEFAILLPSTPKAGAVRVAEKVRLAVEQARIGGGAGRPVLTVSVGVACFPGDGADEDQLVDRADRALYRAKVLGKNRVETYSDERRQHGRQNASLRGHFSGLTEKSRSLGIGNLSEGGLLFETPEPPAVGAFLHVRFALAPAEEPVEGVLRVIRVLPGPEAFEVGARFVHLSRAHRNRLRRCLERAHPTSEVCPEPGAPGAGEVRALSRPSP